MAEKKYEKNILTELTMPADIQVRASEYAKRATRILWLEDFIIKGAPTIIASWYWKATDKEATPEHTHDYDEVLGFLGGDPDNPKELNGEVEIWLDDEKYNITKSCFIYCPAGLKHCPLRVVRVDKPMLFLAVSITDKYIKDNIVPEAFKG